MILIDYGMGFIAIGLINERIIGFLRTVSYEQTIQMSDIMEVLYNEEDAEFDSRLVLSEIEDFSYITHIGNFFNNKNLTPTDEIVYEKVSQHFRNLRFLKYAQEALQVEKNLQYCFLESIANKADNQNNSHVAIGSVPLAITIQDFEDPSAMTIRARDIEGADKMISSSGAHDSSIKQLKKDIERDRLLVNGQRIVGAEAGLDNAIQFIGNVCDNMLTECDIPKFSPEVRERFVLSVLNKASRSQSGGVAFQAAQSLIDPSKTILVPQSTVVPPLNIIIYVGSFPTNDGKVPEGCKHDPGRNNWGIVCRVTCETLFHIQNFDAPRESSGQDNEKIPAMFISVASDGIKTIDLSHNSYVSVMYRDYVMFRVLVSDESQEVKAKIVSYGEMGNIENLYDDWKLSASVSICNVKPVYPPITK